MKKAFFAFRLYYLLYVLLAFHAFVNETRWMRGAAYILTVTGLLFFLYMVLQYRVYLKICNIWLIGAFLVSYVLSALLNYQYGVTDNIKELIWLLLMMVVLYASAAGLTVEEMKREYFFYSLVWIVYCTVVNAISISMVVWGREFRVIVGASIEDYKVVGFKWGRLWGMYDDPNHGATITVIAIVLTLYVIQSVRKKQWKMLLGFTLLIQFFYIVLSDSRTGLVSMGMAIFTWSAISLFRSERKKGHRPFGALGRGLIFGILLAAVVFGAAFICKQQYNVADKKLEAMLPEKWKRGTGQVDRKEDLEKDKSNGRIDIWKSGFEIVQESPIFGVSFRNMVPYAEAHLPETYLIQNENGVKYDSLHNSFIDVLVSQGIIGGALILVLMVNTLLLVKKKFCCIPEEHRSFAAACFTGIVAMGTGCLFLSMVFYLNAPQAFFFWLCLGDFVTVLQKA